MVDNEDFYELAVGGRKVRGLSLAGLSKAREALGLPPIPGPSPGEAPKAYLERVKPLRTEALAQLRKAPFELLDRLFGDDARHAFGALPLRDIFFFTNGNVAACDERGQQVPEEQGQSWRVVLEEKASRGVVDDATIVHLPTGETTTYGEIRRRRDA